MQNKVSTPTVGRTVLKALESIHNPAFTEKANALPVANSTGSNRYEKTTDNG